MRGDGAYHSHMHARAQPTHAHNHNSAHAHTHISAHTGGQTHTDIPTCTSAVAPAKMHSVVANESCPSSNLRFKKGEFWPPWPERMLLRFVPMLKRGKTGWGKGGMLRSLCINLLKRGKGRPLDGNAIWALYHHDKH